MSPLATYLWSRNDNDNLSFGEMSRRATRAGFDLSSSRIAQIAKDDTGRLTADTIKALAAGCDVTPEFIAQLDDERYGFVRRHVAHDADPKQTLADASTEALLEEIARRAGGGKR